MSKTNPESDAFPTDIYFGEQIAACSDGLTKREYFAAKAIQGLLANPNVITGIPDNPDPCGEAEGINHFILA